MVTAHTRSRYPPFNRQKVFEALPSSLAYASDHGGDQAKSSAISKLRGRQSSIYVYLLSFNFDPLPIIPEL